MDIVFWDTRFAGVSKDFAGGNGMGGFPCYRGVRGKIVRHFYRRDRRPVALLFAYLAGAFESLGHRVRYVVDRPAPRADLIVFCPALVTLRHEKDQIRRLLAAQPGAAVLVVGTVASTLADEFADLPVTVIRGEPEQVLWRLDEVFQHLGEVLEWGKIDDLNRLPFPSWTPFGPRRFRIGFDFWRFPTALIQASRGCMMTCNYCPYLIPGRGLRQRNPETVAEEIRRGVQKWGFRSFKFRDPLFGANRPALDRLIELLGRLPQPVQFSVESRIEFLGRDVLRDLRRVGLTSVTVGLETPDRTTLDRYARRPIAADRQQEFIAACRDLGIRTVAGFMIGFPDDTKESIARVLTYARAVGPTFANFNIVTPYPGTEFYETVRHRITTEPDFSHFTGYTPVLRTDHLDAEAIRQLHHWCLRRFYFRWEYLRDNAPLIWPAWQRLAGLVKRLKSLRYRSLASASSLPSS